MFGDCVDQAASEIPDDRFDFLRVDIPCRRSDGFELWIADMVLQHAVEYFVRFPSDAPHARDPAQTLEQQGASRPGRSDDERGSIEYRNRDPFEGYHVDHENPAGNL